MKKDNLTGDKEDHLIQVERKLAVLQSEYNSLRQKNRLQRNRLVKLTRENGRLTESKNNSLQPVGAFAVGNLFSKANRPFESEDWDNDIC